jgi:hypothetical protein
MSKNRYPRTRPPLLQALAVVSLAASLAAFGTGVQAQVSDVDARLAQERAALAQLRATTAALIEALVAQGLLPRAKADELLRQASSPPAATAAGQWGAPPAAAETARPVQRIPFLSEATRQEMREQVRDEVLAVVRSETRPPTVSVPGWTRRISLGGDLRLRQQSEFYDEGNLRADQYRLQSELAASPAWAPDVLNTTEDRHRLTLRARLELNGQINEQTSGQLRLSTGGTTSPSSASQTLGNGFNRLSVGWDRAWLRWRSDIEAPVWQLTGGRMGVPFHGTTLLWPDDLSLDGAVVEYNRLPGGRSELRWVARVGAFPLQEFNVDSRDKWLLGLQAGFEWSPYWATSVRASLAYYDFQRIEGVRENRLPPTGALEGTVPYLGSAYPDSIRSKGNTLINLNSPQSLARPTWGLASRFRPVNLTLAGRFLQLLPLELGVQLDLVKNLGFDAEEIERRARDPRVRLVSEKNRGFELRAHVGSAAMTEPGAWQAFVALRQFERDAWPDAFTDTTWHVGGTNYKGWAIGGTYVLDPMLRLGWRWTSTRNLDDGVIAPLVPTGTLSSAPFKVDVLQVELSSRF